MCLAGEVFHLPGGYVDDGGAVHREVELGALTGADEEHLAGLNVPAAVFITQLLARSVRPIGTLVQPGPGAVRNLLVGDREFLVIKLRQMTAGDNLDLQLSCPNQACGKLMDLSFSLADMPIEERPVDSRLFELRTADGDEIVFSLPTEADQEALVARADHSDVVYHLLARCIQRIGPLERPDPHVIASLPESIRTQIEERMRELSPDVTAEVEGICPECAALFSHPFDLSSMLLAELIGNRRVLEREVHFLSWHYHWSEREILSMTRAKRRRYVDLVVEEIEGAQEV